MRRFFHCRRRGAATLDPGLAVARLCRRRASAIRSREGGRFSGKTTIKRTSKVRHLSKGMVAQLHLALVMAIDAKLLVLDEPTLGLDILYRKQFYDSLLNDYFDGRRTIVVTTHQVEEIQDVLTDLKFINHGRIVLECSMEEFESRYVEVMVNPDHLTGARALKPMHERQVFGRSVVLFENVDRGNLRAWRSPHAQHRRLVRCCDGQGPEVGWGDRSDISRRWMYSQCELDELSEPNPRRFPESPESSAPSYYGAPIGRSSGPCGANFGRIARSMSRR